MDNVVLCSWLKKNYSKSSGMRTHTYIGIPVLSSCVIQPPGWVPAEVECSRWGTAVPWRSLETEPPQKEGEGVGRCETRRGSQHSSPPTVRTLQTLQAVPAKNQQCGRIQRSCRKQVYFWCPAHGVTELGHAWSDTMHLTFTYNISTYKTSDHSLSYCYNIIIIIILLTFNLFACNHI